MAKSTSAAGAVRHPANNADFRAENVGSENSERAAFGAFAEESVGNRVPDTMPHGRNDDRAGQQAQQPHTGPMTAAFTMKMTTCPGGKI